MSIKDTSAQDTKIHQPKLQHKRWGWAIIAIIISISLLWQVAPLASRWSKAEQTISSTD